MNNESIESVTTTAGLAGFIVLFSLGIACWFLFRGMSKRLRNIRLREERDAEQRQASTESELPDENAHTGEGAVDSEESDGAWPADESDGAPPAR